MCQISASSVRYYSPGCLAPKSRASEAPYMTRHICKYCPRLPLTYNTPLYHTHSASRRGQRLIIEDDLLCDCASYVVKLVASRINGERLPGDCACRFLLPLAPQPGPHSCVGFGSEPVSRPYSPQCLYRAGVSQ